MKRIVSIVAVMVFFIAVSAYAAQKMSTSQSAEIETYRSEAWELLTDVERWEDWNPAVKSADIKKGDGYSPGTVIRFVPVIGDKEASAVTLELAVSKKLEKLEYRGKKAGMDIVFGFDIEQLDHSIKVTSYETISGPTTALFKMMYGQDGLDKEHRTWVESMKKKLETETD